MARLNLKPGELLHRMALLLGQVAASDVAMCGVKRRDGAKMVSRAKGVTCPACLTKIRERQAQARLRAPAL